MRRSKNHFKTSNKGGQQLKICSTVVSFSMAVAVAGVSIWWPALSRVCSPRRMWSALMLHATNYTYVSKFTTIRMVFSWNVPKRIKFWIFNNIPLSNAAFIATKIISRVELLDKITLNCRSTFSLRPHRILTITSGGVFSPCPCTQMHSGIVFAAKIIQIGCETLVQKYQFENTLCNFLWLPFQSVQLGIVRTSPHIWSE